MTKFQHVKRVKELCFSLINPEELKNGSVCTVSTCELYTKNREPKFDGINDPRMGTIDNNILCDTCHQNTTQCPGHFGQIELCMPVYNPLFIQIVMMLLNIVCSNCSTLLITTAKILQQLHTTKKKISFIYKQNSKKHHSIICPSCDFVQSNIKYIKDGMILLKHDLLTKTKTKFYASDTLKIFQQIKHSDIELIGLNPTHSHPVWLLFQNYPVVPQCVRPSINFGCNLRSEDDIVYKLSHLLRSNKTLQKKIQITKSKIY